ncbi:universal stress protein [Haloarculaceae archaeon H-GB11]|nr:universal stress protein [Haloarculaceae archaeon H-GB11]
MTESGYQNILLPTDGSDLALEALRESLTLAELSGATIHVLYVVDDAKIAELASGTGIDDVSLDGDVDGLFRRFEAIGEHALDDLREAATGRGVALTTAIRKGLPEEEILAYVDEEEIDLLVMGTHGRRGIERYILGSTTERVLRQSPVPVLTVRGGSDRD